MSKPENYRVKKQFDPDSRYGKELDVQPESGEHKLDSEEMDELHNKLMDWFDQCREAHAENRIQQAMDEDFYDGDQWREDDAQVLIERGQAPLVFNLIKPAVDWVSGTEKRTRVDFNVLPKKDTPFHRESALNKLKLLKHVSDSSKAQFHRSDAFKTATVTGLGWMEVGIRNDESDEPIYIRCENWRNIWHDNLSQERDLSDARYIFRSRWVDLDIAIAMFPDREEALKQAAYKNARDIFEDDDLWMGNAYHHQRDAEDPYTTTIRKSFSHDPHNASKKRDRVRLIECWYRKPRHMKLLRGDPSNCCYGEEYDEQDHVQAKQMEEGILSSFDAVVMEMRCCIMTEKHVLQEMKSPYKHNEFPFTPIWGFRRGRDKMPYGIVRNARDPQEDLNKRRSKALHILSTTKVIADKNAVDDWDETADELARPDGIIKVRGDARFEINTDRQLAQQHIDLMMQDREFVNNISGVTGENLGLDSNAVSGKAILAKQTEGSVVTFELFDNLRLALQLNGEKILSLVEQWYDQPKVVRILGNRGQTEFVTLNDIETDPVTGQQVRRNDITETRADFVVDSQDFRQSVRQAMFEQMLNMMKTLPPEISINMLDLVIDLSDLPGKDELVDRIRKINGQTAPGEQETPEQAQARQAQEQMEQLERQLQQQDMTSKIGERDARSQKLRLEAQDLAMDSGAKAALMGGAAPAADSLLKSAGFQDQQEQPDG